MKLGEVIRSYRLHKERTLRDLAKELTVSPATLLRLEQGKPVEMATGSKVLRWLLGTNKKGGQS